MATAAHDASHDRVGRLSCIVRRSPRCTVVSFGRCCGLYTCMNATPTTNHPDQSDAPSRGRTLLVDVRQAAEMLSLSRSSIYQLIGTGQLSPMRIGRSVRFSVEHLEHFVAALALSRRRLRNLVVRPVARLKK